MTRSIHVDEVIDQLAISSPLKKKKMVIHCQMKSP